MSNYSIKIPDIGEGITEVELVEWFVGVGDKVTEDQNVASVMTDKVSVEITSPVTGEVTHLGGAPGDLLAVGADLVQIALSTETAATASTVETGQASSKGGHVETATSVSDSESESPEAITTTPAFVPATTPHERLLQTVQASPAVRKRAAELSVDLVALAQRLGKTRVHHADLDQHLVGFAEQKSSFAREKHDAVTTVPVRGLRRQIAKKMLESTQNIPHFTYVESVDVTALEQWRQQLNQQWEQSRGRLTLLPFLIRAMCLALKKHPHLNARYDEKTQQLQQYEAIHVAVATQTDQGLMVPVLEFAQHLDFWQMAEQIRDLAQQAQQGQQSLAAKSTITISSLGALGGVMATPIINAPEVAIIGVNRQMQQPVVVEGQIQIRTLMHLSSSFDHRFIDGYDAASFIQDMRKMLEAPQLYLVQ